MMTKTAIVIATSTRGGVLVGGNPPTPSVHQREITDDFHNNQNRLIIGAAVADAVEHAWKAGHDPTTITFKLRFE